MSSLGVYRALFLKSASFQMRQLKSNIFQFILVGLLMGVLIAIQNSPGRNDTNSNFPPQRYINDNNNTYFSTNLSRATYTTAFWNLWMYTNDPENQAEDLMQNGLFSKYQNNIGNSIIYYVNETTPILVKMASNDDIIANYTSNRKKLEDNYYGSNYNATEVAILSVQLPTAAILFDEVSPTSLKYTLETRPQGDLGSIDNYVFSIGYLPSVMIMYMENWLTNAFLQPYTSLNQTINTLVQPFSEIDYPNSFNFAAVVGLNGIFFIPSTLSFILPVITFTIVSEKQERLVEMMKMNGIGMVTYWLSSFTFLFIVYLILALAVVILGAAGSIPFFVDVNAATYLILFFLYGLAQTSFAFLMSTFFSKARTSVLLGYFFVMIFSGLGSSLQMIVFKLGAAPLVLMLFPVFALQRGIYLITYVTSGPSPPGVISLTEYSPLAQVYVYLLFETPIYLIVAWYLDKILPRENGVRYSPLFPFIELRKWYLEKYPSAKAIAQEKVAIITQTDDGNGVAVDDVATVIEFEDEDCLKERRRVHSASNFLIKIVDLHKKYPGRGGQPAKDALTKFCLALEQGDCLGLLGPNGAGKTTLISILCGLSAPTSGTAYVSGYDINTEMYKVHQILGFCPQHDILWQDLTIEEHLLFYCRLKGYNRANELSHVRQIAQNVGLGGEHLTKKVSELSGGMKRRLSISIALVGDSRLVLLDEPTTGLDPDTRRHVWDIINAHKAHRSIIITTHNIDEADVLCSKIAIMSMGSLKCIGSSLYLKNKFGAGYKLSVNLAPGAEDGYKSWVKSNFKQAELDPSSGTTDFIIPAGDMNVAHVFSIMKKNKEQLGVLEWAVNQMSLEEVFLKMVTADESQF